MANKFVQYSKKKPQSQPTLITCVSEAGVLHMFDYMKPAKEMTHDELVAATRHLMDLSEHRDHPNKFLQIERR